MAAHMIILRIIHIFSGVFWVGASFFNVGFLQPTVLATGAEGQKVMQHLTLRTRFTLAIYATSTLTFITGLIMYWTLFGFDPAVLRSGYGLWITIGAIAGTVAWIIVIFVIRGIINRIKAVGASVQVQGTPPTPEQTAQLQTAGRQMVKMGHWGVIVQSIALLGMSIAQYM